MEFNEHLEAGNIIQCLAVFHRGELKPFDEFVFMITVIERRNEFKNLENIILECLKKTKTPLNKMANTLIREVTDAGYFSCVKYLMSQDIVDVTDCGNYALLSATRNGHLDIVKEILKDSRVNPADYHHNAIIIAAENNQADICYYLYQREDIQLSLTQMPSYERELVIQTLKQHKLTKNIKAF